MEAVSLEEQVVARLQHPCKCDKIFTFFTRRNQQEPNIPVTKHVTADLRYTRVRLVFETKCRVDIRLFAGNVKMVLSTSIPGTNTCLVFMFFFLHFCVIM